MKILQVVPYFKPSHLGGPAINVFNLSRELAKRHDVTVWTSNALNINENFESGEEKIEDFDVIYMNRYFPSKLFLTPRILNLSKKHLREFDIIHLHDFRTFPNIIVSHYARKYRVPYVFSARGALRRIAQKFTRKIMFDILFSKKILLGASAFVAISKDEVKEYKELDMNKKIFLIPNGIEKDFLSKTPKGRFRKEYGIGNEKMVLFLGRISMRKGIQHIIEAIKDINCKFVISGTDDGYLNEIKKIIKKTKTEDKIIITGFIEGKKKLFALTDADVFVYPSKYEAFGVSIIEALSYNVPVIVGSDCGIRDFVIENKFGYSVEFGDVGSLNSYIKKSFGKKIKSRDKVFETFSWKKITRNMERAYKYSI